MPSSNQFSKSNKAGSKPETDNMHEYIKQEIANANFVTLIVDESTDLSIKYMVSIAIRFLKNKEKIELFLGYYRAKNQKAESIFEIIKNVNKEFNFTGKIICQKYDGANVLAGKLNGVKKK